MNQFTSQELKDLLILTKKAQITGEEALPVVMLQQKIANLLQPTPPKKEEAKKDEKK